MSIFDSKLALQVSISKLFGGGVNAQANNKAYILLFRYLLRGYHTYYSSCHI